MNCFSLHYLDAIIWYIESWCNMNFLVTYEQGIAQVTLKDNKLQIKPYIDLLGASYLDVHEHTLFTISEHGISVYDNHKVLLYKDTQFDHSPSHITYVADHHMIVSSNYHHGLLSIYRFDNEKTTFLKTFVFPQGSHVHQAYYSRELKKLLVVDLGLDAVFIYDILQDDLSLSHTLSIPKGSGPRHLCVSKEGFIFIITEYSNEVFVYSDSYELLDVYKTLDHPYAHSDSSAIRLSHDENYVFAVNRFEDYITIFKQKNGHLERLSVVSTMGKHARDFNINSDDTYILIANRDSNTITYFKHASGHLTYVDSVTIERPTMIFCLD